MEMYTLMNTVGMSRSDLATALSITQMILSTLKMEDTTTITLVTMTEMTTDRVSTVVPESAKKSSVQSFF